jgi:hypothetical protein
MMAKKLFILVLIVALSALAASWAGSWALKGLAQDEASALAEAAFTQPAQQLDQAALDRLPAALARHLESSGMAGRVLPRFASFTETGRAHLGLPGPDPMRYEASIWLSLAEPGAVWDVQAGFPLCPLYGLRERLAFGQGESLCKAFNLFDRPLVQGPALTQALLYRWLRAVAVVPGGLAAAPLKWRSLGPHAAEATASIKGLKATAIFRLGPDGLFESLGWGGPDAAILLKGYRQVGGIKSPARLVCDGVESSVQGLELDRP